ncbi:ethanolamine utilization protein EutJ [Lacrimispora xylanisolvens]|uniref:ethanolamine utilization protein EutJ n=1 Tax=Lacrimispora xylanisolvens TaxID=384636 RepID=UPI002402BDF1
MIREQTEMDRSNEYLLQMDATSEKEFIDLKQFVLPLKVGVDLGTSNIVVTVLDQKNRPVAFEMEPANVVKDGIVVQFLDAVRILEKLKGRLEQRLNTKLEEAATAIPPGIMTGNTKVISNVVENAGFHVTHVIDEPEAAAVMMGIRDGIVVDIGGGTTGVSAVKDGQIMYSMDEPTGGTHMTLVISGAMELEFSEAEQYKKKPGQLSAGFYHDPACYGKNGAHYPFFYERTGGTHLFSRRNQLFEGN